MFIKSKRNIGVRRDECFTWNYIELGSQMFQEPRSTDVNSTVVGALYLVVCMDTIKKLLKVPSVFICKFDMQTGSANTPICHNESRPITTLGRISGKEVNIVMMLWSAFAKFYA